MSRVSVGTGVLVKTEDWAQLLAFDSGLGGAHKFACLTSSAAQGPYLENLWIRAVGFSDNIPPLTHFYILHLQIYSTSAT